MIVVRDRVGQHPGVDRVPVPGCYPMRHCSARNHAPWRNSPGHGLLEAQGSFLALAAPKCNLPGAHMIPRALLPVNSAHTRYMREDKVPLCDRHHFKMRAEQSSFLPKIIFKCASQDCQRHYGRLYGYFDLLPHMPPSQERIDPANRQMKVCARRQSHSYMAITRPKNTAPDAKNLWCWHCFECSKAK